MLTRTVVFLSLVCVTLGAVVLSPLEEKPKKYESIEGCYISELDAVIPFGKSEPDNKYCMEYRCGKSMVEIATCGTVITQPPCYKIEDNTKKYPKCCGIVRCDKNLPENEEITVKN